MHVAALEQSHRPEANTLKCGVHDERITGRTCSCSDIVKALRLALAEALNELETWVICYDNKMAQGDALARILELRKLTR